MRRLFLVLVCGMLFLLASCGGNSTSVPPNGGGGSSGTVVLNSIQISPNQVSISQGTTQAFTATGSYSDGSSKDLTGTVDWSCLLPNVATVNSTGLVTALASGSGSPATVLISATSGSISNSAQLTIKSSDVIVKSLAVTPATATIGFDEQQQFAASATFSDGSTQDVTNVATWSSSGGFITSNSGLAVGQTLGTSSVTASFGGQSNNPAASLIVGLSDLASASILPAVPSVPNRTQITFSVSGTFNDGSTRDLTSLASDWSSSNDSVATNFGPLPNVFTTVSSTMGPTTVSASIALPLNGTVTPPPITPSAATLTVDSATLSSIALSPANATIAPTTKLDLIGTGTFSDGSASVLPNLSWSTLEPAVASVNGSGVVTGVAQGAATINVFSSFALGHVQGSTTVNVSSATLQSIAVNPATAFLPPGGTLQFSAIGTFSDGSTQDVSSLAVFASTNSSNSTTTTEVATISGQLATAQGPGQTTITATIGTLSATANLLVVPPSQVSLTVSPATASVAAGATAQLSATGTYGGATQDFTTLVDWSTSAPTAATVGYQTGLVSGLTAQSSAVTVTATLGTVSATSQVTVQ